MMSNVHSEACFKKASMIWLAKVVVLHSRSGSTLKGLKRPVTIEQHFWINPKRIQRVCFSKYSIHKDLDMNDECICMDMYTYYRRDTRVVCAQLWQAERLSDFLKGADGTDSTTAKSHFCFCGLGGCSSWQKPLKPEALVLERFGSTRSELLCWLSRICSDFQHLILWPFRQQLPSGRAAGQRFLTCLKSPQ